MAMAQDFPASVTQQGILQIKNYITNVVNDIMQSKTEQIANDYSSTGRSLASLAQKLNPGKGCPQTSTDRPAKTRSQAIADLQIVQLRLSKIFLNVITKDLAEGQADIYDAIAHYGDVAEYVQKLRTDC